MKPIFILLAVPAFISSCTEVEKMKEEGDRQRQRSDSILLEFKRIDSSLQQQNSIIRDSNERLILKRK